MFVSALLLAIQVDSSTYVRIHREADRALVAGRAAEARAAFEQCLELAPQNPTAGYGLACAHARAGDEDAALRALGQAVEWGYVEAGLARWDEDLASLRGEDGFELAIGAMSARAHVQSEVRRATLESGAQSVPAGNDDVVSIFDLRRGSGPVDVAIDPSAARIAVGHSSGKLTMLDPRSGLDLVPTCEFGSAVWSLDVSPDGEVFAVLTWDGRLHLWRPDDSAPPKSVVALEPTEEEFGWAFGAYVAFDPTGERVLAAGSDRGAILCRASGETLRKLDGEFGDFFDARIAWSSDGKHFASWSDGTVTFHNGVTGAPTGETFTAPSRVIGFAHSPDGRTIATGDPEGIVRLWQAAGAANEFVLSGELDPPDAWFTSSEARELAFSPDGRHLAVSYGSSVHISIIDVEARSISWTSEFQGGRMGEHVDLRWNAEGRRLWWSWTSGALELCGVDLDANYAVQAYGPGCRPAVAGGKTVFTNGCAVTALDAASGRVLWTRVALGREGLMFQTPGGYFDCDFDDLSELAIDRPSFEGNTLVDVATRLFDPKRVRAARAGVALAPNAW